MKLLEILGYPVSNSAGDLLQNMLQQDPRNRFTLAQVMEHSWVRLGT